MGELVSLRNHSAAGEPSELVELAEMTHVGAVRIIAACEIGCDRTGPYKIVLRSEGVPDRCVVTMTPDTAYPEHLMHCLRGYAEAMGWTLRYAADNPSLIEGLPPMPEGAA